MSKSETKSETESVAPPDPREANFAPPTGPQELVTITLRPLRLAPEPSSDGPEPKRGSFFGGYGLFATLVLLPLAAASVYLFAIASDRYLSQAQFVVRAAASSGVESAASALSSQGMSRAQGETYIVCEFIGSRDALGWLDKNANIRDAYSDPRGDMLNRFPSYFGRHDFEGLYRYYKRHVWCDVDDATGISTINAVAFSPENAQKIVVASMKAAEDLLNRMNARSVNDAVADADRQVTEVRQRVDDVERRLAAYRSQVGVVNDQSENTASLSTITALSTQLAQLRTDYQQRQMLSPDSPVIQSLKARIASYESEIARRESDLAGDSNSLASKIGGLDALQMEKTIAQKQWESAEANRLLALQNERRQHLYLQAVVQPNIEDEPSYPRRWLYLLLTFVVAEMLFVIVRTLREFAMEHAL